jgi:DNA sulfur modification protein DndD
MHLRSITLRDWKAYEQARFDFPAPTANRNIVLIGGQNGFGKTTLFEALVLGLFGRDGLKLVQRATAAEDDDKKVQSYRDFIQRALHRSAPRFGRTSCRISLVFEDEGGEPVEIDRTWHFTESGALRAGNNAETLKIFVGKGRRVAVPPRSESDPDGWYRDWIARRFLPAHLAGFFLFDGEAASAYAERDMGVQVREGIEGLLGLTWLRRLAESLRAYAVNRRNQVPRGVTSEAIDELETQISQIETELKNAEERLRAIEAELADADSQRTALTNELAGYGTGTRAKLEDLIKQKADQEKQYAVAQDELFRIAEMDLPLALAGEPLRKKLELRLDQEQRREQWLAAASETKARAEGVLKAIEQDLAQVSPALVDQQADAVRAAIMHALEHLWHPPPENAAEAFRHAHLSGRLREEVRGRLSRAAVVSSETIANLLSTMAGAAAALRDLTAGIDASQVTAPQLDEKKDRIKSLNSQIDGLRTEEGEKRNLIASRTGEVRQKRADLARTTSQMDQSARPARLAARAEKVAEMLEVLCSEALPLQTAAIAEAMTKAIRAMAHKKDLFNRVEIPAGSEVQLLGPDGRNLREMDLSAGEKQIFTQALFAAVTSVSERIFPLVVDTPLGRLDEEHRLGVLRHLAQRKSQVFLISTNTEVVGPYLEAIRSRVAKAYKIENKTEGDVGTSWPVEGYFPGQGL